jgi:hypothetical protein
MGPGVKIARYLRFNLWGGRGSNPRPTDYESLYSISATRRNRTLKPVKSPVQRHF